MKTYKIGNKITGVIRAYNAGKIGDSTMTYNNEPYTVLNGVKASLTFDDYEVTGKTDFNHLYFNSSKLKTLTITDVPLTEKILNLIFKKHSDALSFNIENAESDDDKHIYLNAPKSTIYQVFIYDSDGELEAAYGTLTNTMITVENAASSYLIVYSYKSDKAFYLDSNDNNYLTVDLKIEGNIDDQTSDMFIHIEKAGVQIEKSLYFTERINAVDLTFNIIEDSENYISVE